MENLANSAYLRLARVMDSSKVDAMGREANQDTKLVYKTIPLCITFATLEKKSIFNHQGTWTKVDIRLGRPEDPLYITIQTKKANSRVKMLPSATWGRMSDTEKDAHVNLGIE